MKQSFLTVLASMFILSSCSVDSLFDDIDNPNDSYDMYVSVDLSKPYSKEEFKENFMFMEAMKRIDQNIRIEHGVASLSHVTAQDLNINEEFFDFMSSLLDQMDSKMVKEYLIQSRKPRTRSTDYETQAAAFEMMGYAIAAAKLWSIYEGCPLIYDLFIHWINGGGDYVLSSSEWSDVKSCINSNKPSSFGSKRGPDSQMGGYYYVAQSNLNSTKYHYALGDTHAFWNESHQCIGIYELYDMNPGQRGGIAEYAVRYAKTYGTLMGTARDYYVKAGYYKTNE